MKFCQWTNPFSGYVYTDKSIQHEERSMALKLQISTGFILSVLKITFWGGLASYLWSTIDRFSFVPHVVHLKHINYFLCFNSSQCCEQVLSCVTVMLHRKQQHQEIFLESKMKDMHCMFQDMAWRCAEMRAQRSCSRTTEDGKNQHCPT